MPHHERREIEPARNVVVVLIDTLRADRLGGEGKPVYFLAQGKIDIDQRAPVPEWDGEGDPRQAITTSHLLRYLN